MHSAVLSFVPLKNIFNATQKGGPCSTILLSSVPDYD